MLEILRIRNLALIDEIQLEFHNGMNVITGETGAGKSFILKAIGFLLGDKLTVDMIRPGKENTYVEGIFYINNEEIILRREISRANGRTRSYINNNFVSISDINKLRESLITNTSQHSQLHLLQSHYQSTIIDTIFPEQELILKRDKILSQLKHIAQERSELEVKQKVLDEKRDLFEMQRQEFLKVAPKENEDIRLEEIRATILASKHSRDFFEKAITILYGENGSGLINSVGKFSNIVQKIAQENSNFVSDAEEIAFFHEKLIQFASNLKQQPTQYEDADIDAIEARLFSLAQLKRKLKRNLPEIFDLMKTIETNLSFLDASSLDFSRLNKEEERLVSDLVSVVEKITPLRHNTVNQFVKKLVEELCDLGFSKDIQIIPNFRQYEIWPNVNDEQTSFHWAPNPGQVPMPLEKIASGGELSRFFLAVTSICQNNETATYIFDEVDAGIGGITLNKLVDKLQNLAKKKQMLIITHWPQLAAKADKHFYIQKNFHDNNTFIACKQLDNKERHSELARMAGGGIHGEALATSLFN